MKVHIILTKNEQKNSLFYDNTALPILMIGMPDYSQTINYYVYALVHTYMQNTERDINRIYLPKKLMMTNKNTHKVRERVKKREKKGNSLEILLLYR